MYFAQNNSSICVMNADGSNLRELTGHNFMNTEPYWTRDGSNQITWSRMIPDSYYYLHKVTISNDETMIDVEYRYPTFEGSVK